MYIAKHDGEIEIILEIDKKNKKEVLAYLREQGLMKKNWDIQKVGKSKLLDK